MPVNVIGLLNVSVDKEEYVINEHLRLISREFFEKLNISMPPDIRFYKTFIVSTYDFGTKFDMSCVHNDYKDFIPTFLLWAVKLTVTEYDIVNSEWFCGDSYEKLKEFVAISNQNINISTSFLDGWVSAFKIGNIVHDISEGTILDTINLHGRIINQYKAQDKSPEEINLHWLYAFTKFQECCAQPSSRHTVLYITSALEFLLVNTSNESEYRSAYYAALIYSDEFNERIICYNFLKWAYSISDKFLNLSPLDMNLFVDKSELAENIFKLKDIFSKVLLKTLGLTNRELQDKINEMIFNCPAFV